MSDSGMSRSAMSLGDPTEAWKARGRELNEVYAAIAKTVRAFGMEPTPDDALTDLERLAAVGVAAENAVHALIQVLPVTGSWTRGYWPVEPVMPSTIMAEPSEWFDCTDSLCVLHRLMVAPDA